ncbi:MAG: rhodanese-like domain-containing protein [Chloroflexi bacterium]|nr:rhodanese-like domain-containing protein [Chloroflexota bacterium]
MTKSRVRVASILLFITVALVLAACGTGGTAKTKPSGEQTVQTQKVPVEGGGSYTDVDAAGLATMLKNKDFLLVNVHIPYAGEIEGTDLFIPFDKIEENLNKLPADKSAKIVVYCRSGGMSAISARALVKLGYTNVWNLDGGMNAWKAAGYTLLNKGR